MKKSASHTLAGLARTSRLVSAQKKMEAPRSLWRGTAAFLSFALIAFGTLSVIIRAVDAATYQGPTQAAPGGNMPSMIWNWVDSGVTQTNASINIDGDVVTSGNLKVRSGSVSQIELNNGDMYFSSFGPTIHLDRNGWTQLLVGNTTTGGTFTLSILGDITCCENGILNFYDTTNTAVFDSLYNASFRAGGSERMFIQGTGVNAGNVGIGQSNPSFKLDVNGAIRTGSDGLDGQVMIYSEQGTSDYVVTLNPHAAMTQNVTYTLPPDDGTGGQTLTTDGNGALSWTSVGTAGNISGTGTNGYVTFWNGATTITQDTTAGGQFFWDATNHRLGVGTITPGNKLDVPGVIQVALTAPTDVNHVLIGQNTVATGAEDVVAIGQGKVDDGGISIGMGSAASFGSVSIGNGSGNQNLYDDSSVSIGNYAGNASGGNYGNVSSVSIGYGAIGGGYREIGYGSNYDSIGIGNGALGRASSYDNVAIGQSAMYGGASAFTGHSNVGIGSNSLTNVTSGNRNAGVGYWSLLTLSSGFNNAGLGLYSLSDVTTGSDNVGIGANSGQFLKTGNNNTFIGSASGLVSSFTQVNNAVAIGYGSKVNVSNGFVLGDANTLVGIRTDSPTFPLQVNGAIRTGMNGTDGQLRLFSEQGTTDYEIVFNPHAAMTQNVSYTLPPDDGTGGQTLTTDGNGALSWVTPATGGACSGRKFIGKTGTALNGDRSSGNANGYEDADTLCDARFPAGVGQQKAKVCTAEEVMNSWKCSAAADGSAVRLSANDGQAWVNAGPPGYTASANDCGAWNDAQIASYGRLWDFASDNGGVGRMASCAGTYTFSCCR